MMRMKKKSKDGEERTDRTSMRMIWNKDEDKWEEQKIKMTKKKGKM